MSELTDRSVIAEDKRRLILDAAVRVFAHKGFHTSRVGDIAKEAGVAHGLLYHYFSSKDEVLETIFKETWAEVLAAARMVEETDEPARDRLSGIAKIMLRSWRRDPDLVRVLVREVTRGAHVQLETNEIELAMQALQRIVEHGQRDGEFDGSVDGRLAAAIWYGALEEILTGWAFGQLPDAEEDVSRAEQAVVRIVAGGLAGDRAAAPA